MKPNEKNTTAVAERAEEIVKKRMAEDNRKPIHAGENAKDAGGADIRAMRAAVNSMTLSKEAREIAKLSDNFSLTREWFKGLARANKNDFRQLQKVNELIRASNPMSEGTDADGGYLVPDEFSTLVITKLSAIPKMRQYATVIPTLRDKLHVASDDTNATVSWESEGATPTDQKATLTENVLTPYKLKVLSILSEELVSDAHVSVIDYLASQFAQLLGAEEDKQFFTGNGSSKPTGLRTYSPSASNAQAGSSLAYSDILTLFMSLAEQYRTNGVFATSPTGIRLLMGLADSNSRPIFMPSWEAGKPATLFGRPLIEVADWPTNLGAHSNTTEIWFGDLSQYVIADRQGLQISVSTERYWDSDQVGIKAIKRIDGELCGTFKQAVLTGVK